MRPIQQAIALEKLKKELTAIWEALTDRDKKILIGRSGISASTEAPTPRVTLQKLGLDFNLTRERIRQIEAQAIQRLRHPLVNRKPLEPNWMQRPLTEFTLSVRATNCLEWAGIETVGELAQWSQKDLLKIRNMGWKTLGEINQLLEHLKELAEVSGNQAECDVRK